MYKLYIDAVLSGVHGYVSVVERLGLYIMKIGVREYPSKLLINQLYTFLVILEVVSMTARTPQVYCRVILRSAHEVTSVNLAGYNAASFGYFRHFFYAMNLAPTILACFVSVL